MATHSSILSGKFPQQRSLAGYRPQMGSHRVGNNCATKHTHTFLHRLSCFQIQSFTSTSIMLMEVLLPLFLPCGTKTSSKTLNRIHDSGYSCLVPDNKYISCCFFINALDWVKEVSSHLLVCWEFLARMGMLLSHFSRVWLYATPYTAARQAPPSLGFSRQEHWSGLPFPSPMHESEKWKWSCSVMSDS